MSLIVMKFGGSSLADNICIRRAASIIADEYCRNNSVVAVLSACGNSTDELLEKAYGLNAQPPQRELDVLLTAGEQVSVALMAMCLSEMGIPCESLLGWQMGIITDDCHGSANITRIEADRLRQAVAAGKVVLAAGFQGVDELGDVTTLGRGGSDTTAVALAAALDAERCLIYTDVDGVYTADPRKDPTAVKIDRIDYDTMLNMAQNGAKVLHDRSVLTAQRYGVKIEVLSSFEPGEGTMVG